MKKFFTLLCASVLGSAMAMAQDAPSQTVTFYATDYNNNPYASTKSALTLNEDGSYEFANFMNSKRSLSFTFNEADIETYGYAFFELTGVEDLNVPVEVLYFEDTDQYGDYAGYSLYDPREDGEDNPVVIPLVVGKERTLSTYNEMMLYWGEYDYCYIEPSQAKGYDYYGSLWVTGYDASDENWETYTDAFVSFYFNKMENGSSAVKGVEVDPNAPVEYYNLQGVRVDNPQGLVIRRQGGVSTKTIVR